MAYLILLESFKEADRNLASMLTEVSSTHDDEMKL